LNELTRRLYFTYGC